MYFLKSLLDVTGGKKNSHGARDKILDREFFTNVYSRSWIVVISSTVVVALAEELSRS